MTNWNNVNDNYETIKKITLDLSFRHDKLKEGNDKNLASMQVYIQAIYSSKTSIWYHHQKKDNKTSHQQETISD